MAELPKAWQWLQISDIAFVTKLAGFEYTDYVKYEDDGDLPVLKAENAGPNGFRETAFSRVKSEKVSMLKRSVLTGGELLMVFVGAGTGNVGLVPEGRKFFLGPNIGMVRIEPEHFVPKFFEYFLRSPQGNELKLSTVKAVAQPSLSMETIRQIPIPVPSPAEQVVLVELLEGKLDEVYRVETDITAALSRITALRQSILKRAFSGHLVPQDANDEPVSALLARLQAEAPSSPARRKRRAW
jgi:type I restriction enzyme S subunit